MKIKNLFCKIIVAIFCVSNLHSADVTYSTNPTTTLTQDEYLHATHRAIFNNTMTFDGAGYYFILPHINTTPVIVVNNGFTVTTNNLLLLNYSPAHLSLGSGSAIVFGNGTQMKLLKNENLNTTYKFSGTTILDGETATLNLDSSGVIEVQASSTLTIENIKITGLNSTNLRCIDNTASIKFNNVELVSNDRWVFNNGSFNVQNLVRFTGEIFSYTSVFASTISSYSQLVMSNGVTFSYDPATSSPTGGNILCTNLTSKLIFEGAKIKVTLKGFRFTKGTMQFDNRNYLYADAGTTFLTRCLILGDGNSANNPELVVGPAGVLEVVTGVLLFDQ